MKAKAFLLPLLLSPFWGLQAANEMTQELAERYEAVLLRSPQNGAAFDHVIEWYSTQGGGLDALAQRWAAGSGPAYDLLQGLLAERRRNPDRARECYTRAMESADPVPAARLLAALETTEGNFPAAVKAYETALASKTLPPMDRIDLMRSLALLHQRAFEDGKAVALWHEAIRLFPDDVYLLEEAGDAFLAASRYDDARAAFTALEQKSARDPFRRVTASLQLARTAEAGGDTDGAVAIYEKTLAETSEGSWIARDIRSRIEDLFRRRNDLPGLLAYYEKRTGAVPQDYRAFAAMAEVQRDLRKTDEALASLQKAVGLAPGDTGLRLVLIGELERQNRMKEALEEALTLARPADAPLEALLALGNLQWKLGEEGDGDQRKAALATWARIAPEGTRDVARIARLADLLASREAIDEAVAAWQRIIAIEPGAADARLRLAETFAKRGDEKAARTILAELIKPGQNPGPEQYLTLSRAQARMKWSDAARATAREGVARHPESYDLLHLLWQQAIDAGDDAEVMALLPKVYEAAPNDFFADDTLRYAIAWMEGREPKKETIAAWREALKPDLSKPMDARLFLRVALNLREEAAAREALAALEGDPLRLARARADFAQTFGTPEEKVAALEALATADPRQAGESLQAAAQILSAAGQHEEALKRVDQLIERSPADASLYSLYSNIALQAGRLPDAIRRLRDAIHYVEDATSLRLHLVTLLTNQGQQAEAAQILQEAFEKETRPNRRMEIFRQQIQIVRQQGKLEGLIASLREKQAKERGGAHYGVYLAEVFLVQGDYLGAKEELSRGLGKNPNDPQAISRLLHLAIQGQDQEEALRLAARLAEVEPTAENHASYLERLFASGETERFITALSDQREAILKDPAPWIDFLVGIGGEGIDSLRDGLIEEISASSDDPLVRLQIARLCFVRNDFARAQSILWELVTRADFRATFSSLPSNTSSRHPYFFSQLTPLLSVLEASRSLARQDLMQAIQNQNRPSGGFVRSHVLYGMLTPGSQPGAQGALMAPLRALFTLQLIAEATGSTETFYPELRKQLASQRLSAAERISLALLLGDTGETQNLVRTLATHPDPEADTSLAILFRNNPAFASMPEKEAILERHRKADSSYAFEEELMTLQREYAALLNASQGTDRQQPRIPHERVEALLNHPGRSDTGYYSQLLLAMAIGTGDEELALRLLEELRNPGKGKPAASPVHVPPRLLSLLILKDHPKADALFEEINKTMTASGQAGIPFTHPATGASPEASSFPYSYYAQINPYQPGSRESDKIDAWFAKRVTKAPLDRYRLAVIYGNLRGGATVEESLPFYPSARGGGYPSVVIHHPNSSSSPQSPRPRKSIGKRPLAGITELEAIHAAHPGPETAGFLFGLYRHLGWAREALVILEKTPLRKGESLSMRNVTRVSLLRQAGQVEEARKEAEKLARGRIDSSVQYLLQQELQHLGSSINLNQNRFSGISRPSMNPADTTRQRLSELRQRKKNDEAIALATRVLNGPFPTIQDYSAVNLRQAAAETLRGLKAAEAYQRTLTRENADLDTLLRLYETAPDSDTRKEALPSVREAIAKYQGRYPHMSYLFTLLSRDSSMPGFADFIITMLERKTDWFNSPDMTLMNLINQVQDTEDRLRIARTIVNLSEEQYASMLIFYRLSGRTDILSILPQLAETALAAGDRPLAIALFRRALPDAMMNFHTGIPMVLQLAELQLEEGEKEAAAATIRGLYSFSRTSALRASSPDFAAILQSLILQVINPGDDQGGESTLKRLARMAKETGTFEEMLAVLEKKPAMYYMPVSDFLPLLLRTYAGEKDAIPQWRRIASGETAIPYPFGTSIILYTVEALRNEKDAKKLISHLLSVAPPDPQYNHQSLGYLARLLPMIGKFLSDPAILRHLDTRLEMALQQNNGRLVHQELYYSSVLDLLLRHGLNDRAIKLFEASAPDRASGYRTSRLIAIEAKIRGLRDPGAFVLVPVAEPTGEGQLRLRWSTSMETGDERGFSVGWTAAPIGKPPRFAEVEFLAGANIATLEPVAKVNRPAAEGSVKAKVKSPFGLIQARWKLPDGTLHEGPLTPYATGANLLREQDFPIKSARFRSGEPGPLGPESALVYEANSSSQAASLPLAMIPWKEDGTDVIMVSGWVRGNTGTGQLPQLRFAFQTDGGEQQHQLSLPSVLPDQWIPFFSMLTRNSRTGSGLRVPENVGTIRMSITPSSEYRGSVIRHEAAFAGLRVVSHPAEADPELPSTFWKELREALNRREFARGAEILLGGLRSHPVPILQNNFVQNLKQISEGGESLDPFFTLLSRSAFYLPDPIRSRQTALNNRDTLLFLIEKATKGPQSAAARKWLQTLARVPLDKELRNTCAIRLFLAKPESELAKVTAPEILGLLGYPVAEDPNRLIRTGQQADDLSEVLGLVARLKLEPAMLEGLRKEKLTPRAIGITRALEARLLLESDPAAALEAWKASITARTPPNGQAGGISGEVENHLIARFIASDLDPQLVLSALDQWADLYRSYQAGRRPDGYFTLLWKETEPPIRHRAAYRSHWVETALEHFNTSGDRGVSEEMVRNLATELSAAKDWKRLAPLLDQAEKDRSLGSSTMRREIARFRARLAFAQGNVEGMWPVVWVKPSEKEGQATLCWQWSARTGGKNEFLSGVIVDSPAPGETAAGQQGVEILFGEKPGALETIHQSRGTDAMGSVSLSLPKPFGFLQAVATVNGRKIAGPVMVHAAGKRVFPKGDLLPMLREGALPIGSGFVRKSGATAPDGSPGLIIIQANNPMARTYRGPEFPVESGRYYLLRGWFHPPQNGHPGPGVWLKIKLEGGGQRDYSGLTRQSSLPANQWGSFYQIVSTPSPANGQAKAVSITPEIRLQGSQYELAGLELVEIGENGLTQWLSEITQLADRRSNAPDPEPAQIDRLIELARQEPAAAMTRYGQQIAATLQKAGRYEELASLLHQAFDTEINPIFPDTSRQSLFSPILRILMASKCPEPVRMDVIELGIAHLADPSNPRWSGFRLEGMKHFPAERREALREETLRLLRESFFSADPAQTARMVYLLFGREHQRRDLPHLPLPERQSTHPLLELLFALNDPSLFTQLLQMGETDKLPLATWEKAFCLLIFETGKAGFQPDTDDWRQRVNAAFAGIPKGQSLPGRDWPALLEKALVTGEAPPAILHYHHQRRYEWITGQNITNQFLLTELIYSTNRLVASSLAQGDREAALKTADALGEQLGRFKRPVNDATLTQLLAFLQQLDEAGENARSRALYAAGRDFIVKSRKKKPEFERYETAAATPEPSVTPPPQASQTSE